MAHGSIKSAALFCHIIVNIDLLTQSAGMCAPFRGYHFTVDSKNRVLMELNFVIHPQTPSQCIYILEVGPIRGADFNTGLVKATLVNETIFSSEAEPLCWIQKRLFIPRDGPFSRKSAAFLQQR